MIREFDQDKLWADEGICSCAHWLNYQCGIGLNAAREKVRVAHALASLPNIGAAFEKGELSYSKVRAMTRIVTPATEETVLMWAKHSTAHHLETLASRYRKVTRCRETQTADEQYRERSLTHYYDEDGSLVIKGRFPAEQGALLIKALQLGMDRTEAEAAESTSDVTAETSDPEPIAVRRADALMDMAESWLASGPESSCSADRYQVMLHVSAETLSDDVTAETLNGDVTAETPADANADLACELPLSFIEHGPHVTAETSTRLKQNAIAQRRIHQCLEALYIEAGTCVTQWEGERVDYGLATELLWAREFPDD
jgi:hypothetical protein